MGLRLGYAARQFGQRLATGPRSGPLRVVFGGDSIMNFNHISASNNVCTTARGEMNQLQAQYPFFTHAVWYNSSTTFGGANNGISSTYSTQWSGPTGIFAGANALNASNNAYPMLRRGDVFVFSIGTNDTAQGTTLAAFSAAVSDVVARSAAMGVPVILTTARPWGSTLAKDTVPEQNLLLAYNNWIRGCAPGGANPLPGCIAVADIWREWMVEQGWSAAADLNGTNWHYGTATGGTGSSTWLFDQNLHPNCFGAYLGARALQKAFATLTDTSYNWLTDRLWGTTNFFSANHFAIFDGAAGGGTKGAGITGSVPAGVSITPRAALSANTSVAVSTVANADTGGNYLQITVNIGPTPGTASESLFIAMTGQPTAFPGGNAWVGGFSELELVDNWAGWGGAMDGNQIWYSLYMVATTPANAVGGYALSSYSSDMTAANPCLIYPGPRKIWAATSPGLTTGAGSTWNIGSSGIRIGWNPTGRASTSGTVRIRRCWAGIMPNPQATFYGP